MRLAELTRMASYGRPTATVKTWPTAHAQEP